MTQRVVRIGCAAGFWGDSLDAARQLLSDPPIDYLVFDYLAEVTMSILARARAKNADDGYAKDFVSVMSTVLEQVVAGGTKVVANAGGMNPAACRAALEAVAREAGIDLRIAIVEGDDLGDRGAALVEADTRAMDDGRAFPQRPWSINAYLGAGPIAAALDAGAQVVVTGRCVDSALVLGPLVHEFGWQVDDYDLLAAGSLAGHVIECGCQATGGNFTDWESVPGWDDMGFPIVECRADGSFVVTKPAGTGGLVAPATVGEQVLYELADPAAYELPDVVCDFSKVRLEQVGVDRVEVRGARGRTPSGHYKVSATYQDGFRSTAMFTLCGFDAARKAARVADSILERTRRLFAARGIGDYRRTSVKRIGTEELYGPNARASAADAREVVLRIDVHHDRREALEIFAREIAPAGTAMAPGRCSLVGGRPGATPLVRLFSFLIPAHEVQARVDVGGRRIPVEPPRRDASQPSAPRTAASPAGSGSTQDARTADDDGATATSETLQVPLIRVAHARSGDKGDSVNIGVLARDPAFVPLLRAALTPQRVAHWFRHLVRGPVERFEVPGLHAFNLVLHAALDGGGVASLRNDPLGKCFAQMLLAMPVAVPSELAPALAAAHPSHPIETDER